MPSRCPTCGSNVVQIVTGTGASRYVMCAGCGRERPSCGRKRRRGIRRMIARRAGAADRRPAPRRRAGRCATPSRPGRSSWAAMSEISNRASDKPEPC